MVRKVVFFSSVILIVIACAQEPDQKISTPSVPSTAEAVSHMGEKLSVEVQAAISEIVGSDRVISSTKFDKITLNAPTGDSGSRAWTELWIFNPVSLDGKLEISIQEQGPYLTKIEITTWDGKMRVFESDKRD